jgi:hypothetical protein
VDVYSVTIGAGFGLQFGLGKISCADRFWVSRWAKVGCVLLGPFVALEAGVDIQLKDVTISGPCRPEELGTAKTEGWLFDFGPVDVATGPGGGLPQFYGGSVGPSAGAAKVQCYITPL